MITDDIAAKAHDPASVATDQRPIALRTRLVAALLLLVIGLHALTLSGTPLRPGHGSAFSASTLEVSLAPRAETVAETRGAPSSQPLAVPPTGRGLDEASLAAAAQATAAAIRRTSPPPSRRTLGAQSSARAPPLA